jgi:adenosylhomocysteine nucleosidase
MSNRMTSEFPRDLVVMALPLESQGLFERAGIPVLFTGIGKVNAAHALTRRLGEYRHAGHDLPRVINFGTAGSRRHATGTLIACHAFVQRDMDVTGLGVPLGTTPFETIPPMLEFAPLVNELTSGICGSGDTFAISEVALACDVVDMEAYALAKVCWIEAATFGAIKFVTDGADAAAGQDWQQNLRAAAGAFLEIYARLSRT